jgi:CDP-diacylglycerol--glycerol-3-phosphate 3-phosphatidyltransferase/cardiolipin synthase
MSIQEPPASATRHPGFSAADAITAARIPLAIAFVLIPRVEVRLVLLLIAAATDLGDGWVARRFGASRIGPVLDPVVDKLFMAAAFGVVLFSGVLAWYEVLLVVIRDLVASVAVFIAVPLGRGRTIPARLGGKAVTLLQLLTLLAFLLDSPQLRPLAWATGAVALYALWDYNRLFFRNAESND